MQRSCCKLNSLSKGLTLSSYSTKLLPTSYFHFTKSNYSALSVNLHHKYSLPNGLNQRHASSQYGNDKSGGGKAALIGGFGIAALVVGGFGVFTDPKIRALVEDNIPGAKEALQAIYEKTNIGNK